MQTISSTDMANATPKFLSSPSTAARSSGGVRLLTRDAEGYERIVFSEMIVPNTLNSFNDFHTEGSVKEFAYTFMANRFGWDREHDQQDISDKVALVESFIARDGDPDFIPGAWVVGLHIFDDQLWSDVLAGEINGYSYEALVRSLPIEVVVDDNRMVYGITEKDVVDGHVHAFVALLDEYGSVISGGTEVTDGHEHSISRSTYTDDADSHSHVFNVPQPLLGGI